MTYYSNLADIALIDWLSESDHWYNEDCALCSDCNFTNSNSALAASTNINVSTSIYISSLNNIQTLVLICFINTLNASGSCFFNICNS